MTAADRAYAEADAQGLPPKVEDPGALGHIATLLLSSQEVRDAA